MIRGFVKVMVLFKQMTNATCYVHVRAVKMIRVGQGFLRVLNPPFHPSVEKDLSLKFEVHDQTIWNSTPEL